jgi:hypothetical protein
MMRKVGGRMSGKMVLFSIESDRGVAVGGFDALASRSREAVSDRPNVA